ncbi:MAG: zf-HC2 domain-containing protein [Deltaproteobacteria bacterium]|nr:zf-HC2 domain-containing protein [Deltaproteobacteria bacterium]
MSVCNELEPLLSAYAVGDCSAEERERIEAHLASCDACAAERESLAETLALATLPNPGELELHALGAMPGQVHAGWNAQQRTRRTYWRATVGAVMAIAASLLVLAHMGKIPVPQHPVSSDDSELVVEALADGPVESADDLSDTLSDDPEVAPNLYSDEGDD